jgi:cytochrome b
MTTRSGMIIHGSETAARARVWDLFVRVFHWTVAVAFFVAYLTEDDLLTVHVWA